MSRKDVIFLFQKESEERHRIMSNPEIKYLYSMHSKVIHDKHCECAKAITDEELRYSDEYIPTLCPCPACMIQAYITAGAKDPEEIDRYLQFFENAKMTDEQIRSIYVEYGMKTRIFQNTITVWCKDDTWRIKLLAGKGHVRLYHNNYAVRKNGSREFMQGYHIQNISCEDTNIRYALSIIKNYEYKPEEYALHSNSTNLDEGKEKGQKQLKLLEENMAPVEDMLEERPDPQPIWNRIKEFFRSVFKKKSYFEFNGLELRGFERSAEQGYPKDQTICIYVWKDKNNQLSWQTGIYNKKSKRFSVRYGNVVYVIRQEKVIAWKRMTADAMILDEGER